MAQTQIEWVTVNGQKTHAFLTDGTQHVWIETPDDERILRIAIDEKEPVYTFPEFQRVLYYADNLQAKRAGQTDRPRQRKNPFDQ